MIFHDQFPGENWTGLCKDSGSTLWRRVIVLLEQIQSKTANPNLDAVPWGSPEAAELETLLGYTRVCPYNYRSLWTSPLKGCPLLPTSCSLVSSNHTVTPLNKSLNLQSYFLQKWKWVPFIDFLQLWTLTWLKIVYYFLCHLNRSKNDKFYKMDLKGTRLKQEIFSWGNNIKYWTEKKN